MNYIGFYTLLKKEVWRFWKVGFQTIVAPIIVALMYQMVFAHIMKDRAALTADVSYTAFLIPGLVMMSMLQNAFSNTSSSLIQSKIGGHLIFVLLTPISNLGFFCAYTLAAIIRGLIIGLGVIIVLSWFGLSMPYNILWIILFAFLACALMAVLGLLAGIMSEKYDQLATFQNFLIMPLIFLSGVFYSIHSLPNFWRQISYFNPLFYMIDGFRFGFFGISDVNPWLSLAVVMSFLMVFSLLVLYILKIGYKIRQ